MAFMQRLRFSWAIAVVSLWACTGDIGEETDPSGSGASSAGGDGVGAGPGSGGSGAGVGVGGSGVGGEATGGSGGTGQAMTVCERWNADRANMSEGSWSGSVGACDAGDVTAAGRDNALRIVNLYRWLAGQHEVTHDGTRNQKAQECALMMDANNQLSHTPPTSWTCYDADGAEAADKSNIATTPGVQAVDLYMLDPGAGNSASMGHRRWILSNSLGPVGLGTTDSYSCLWVIGGNGGSNAPFVAFPSPGVWPLQAMTASFGSVDDTGWTIQSDSIDLGSASVTITDGGNSLPVTVSQLLGGYGSSYAIRINPQGWTTAAGHTYQVSVSGVSAPIDYSVEVVDCD